MRKVAKLAVVASVMTFPLLSSGTAFADVSTNGTTSDAYGYCIANHIANFNGTQNGIGWARSVSKGSISAEASNPPAACVSTQGNYPQISNNP